MLKRNGHYKLFLVLTCFLYILSSLSFSLCIFYMSKILSYAQEGSISKMLQMTGIAVMFLAVKYATTIAATWARLVFLSGGTIKMRREIIWDLFHRPFRGFRKQNDAYYLNLLGADTDMYAADQLNMIPWIFSGIADIAIYAVSLCILSPWLMLASIMLSMLPLITSHLFTKMTQQRKQSFSYATEKFTNALKEGIEGYEPIRMGRGTESYLTRFINACKQKQEAFSASSMANAISMQTLYVTACILDIGCSVVGGWLLIRGVLSIAMLFAAVSYSSNLANAFTNITEYIVNIRSTKKITDKLKSECKTKIWTNSMDLTYAMQDVVYENVSFSFGDRQLYQNFSYHFIENGCYAVIGESGSGKSTLFKLLLKFYDDYTGIIRLAGHDIRELSEDDIFEIVGVVDQTPFLFNASLYENIMLFSNEIAEDSVEYQKLLHDINLTAFAQRVGNAPLGDFGDNISGGERQRISIARAMRRHPRIIIFDEPTTGLDPENVELINKFIFANNDMLRIVISHNWDKKYLEHFDDVIHINNK